MKHMGWRFAKEGPDVYKFGGGKAGRFILRQLNVESRLASGGLREELR